MKEETVCELQAIVEEVSDVKDHETEDERDRNIQLEKIGGEYYITISTYPLV